MIWPGLETAPLEWEAHEAKWPNADKSRFVSVGDMTWHVQQMGQGPRLLMLHGTGASTHSYQALADELVNDFSLTMVDLPGHGFTSAFPKRSPSLGNVAISLAELLNEMDYAPDYVLGHSAGAAICVELVFRSHASARAIFAINGAFYPFPGFAGQFFPAMAKLLFLNPFVPGMFAATASRSKVEQLIDSTGSKITDEQLGYYETLFSSSRHVRGTLEMMANWDLSTMEQKLRALDIPVHLLIGADDGTIEPNASLKTLEDLKDGTRDVFPGTGHLVHEEQPKSVADCIRRHIKSDK